MDTFGYFFGISLFSLIILSQHGCQGTISCFVCSSRNGSNEGCEDPFNAANQPYIERCKVPKRKHEGEFPAHFCIKLIGTSALTNERLVVRRCVLETMDTQCGKFRFEEELLHGCILTCDLDGCNSSSTFTSSFLVLLTSSALVLIAKYSTFDLSSSFPS